MPFPLLLILFLVFVPACGTGGEPGASPTPPPPPPTAPAPETAPSEGQPILTDAERGRTVTLRVGESALLRLHPPVQWDEPSFSGPHVQASQVNYFDDPGFLEWELRAVSPGSVVVSSAGRRSDGGRAVRWEATIRVVE